MRAGPHEAVVVDTGPDPHRLSRCLDDLDVAQVPMVILSHFHADHVDGLNAVHDHGLTRAIVVSQLSSPPWSAKRVAQTAAQLGARVVEANPGRVMTAGTAKLELWGGTQLSDTGKDESGEEHAVENNSSVVIKATVDELRVVLPGDAEPEEQHHILTGGTDLSSDVLVLPHHGSARQDEASGRRPGQVWRWHLLAREIPSDIPHTRHYLWLNGWGCSCIALILRGRCYWLAMVGPYWSKHGRDVPCRRERRR